jgi:ABC-2 type transport system ATP-binding protein
MSQPIVETRNLSLGFSRKKVIEDLGVVFAKGEWAVIAGRNGAGKSTLLRVLAGVLLPDAGSVIYAEDASARKIGFISDALSLFEDWTVERAILHLSLVLSQKPSLLLIDEVMHMLDPYIRDLFIEALIENMAANQTTVLSVNHTFSEIDKIPERVLVMDEGRFVIDETTEALRGKMKKVVSRDPLPEALPCFFKKMDGLYKEYYIYPFLEELRTEHGVDFQDIALPEIIKAFIGGGYEQKRMA